MMTQQKFERDVILVGGPGHGEIIKSSCGKIMYPVQGSTGGFGWVTYRVKAVRSYGETHYEAHLMKDDDE